MQGYAHLAQEDRRHIEMMRKEGFWETCAVGFSRGVRVSQFQYRNEPERRALFRAWGRVGNWLRWWAMMPLALSDGKSSEGCATADEGLGGGLAVRRVDWATQRFPWPSHGRDPQA